MKFKLVFATATAVGLLMGSGGAQALTIISGSNATYLTQNGNQNSQTVTQDDASGGNQAGGPATADAMTQQGNNNSVTVDQKNGSTLGVPGTYTGTYYESPTYAAPSYILGVDQSGDFNVIDDTQNMGTVLQIQQSASTGPAILGTTNSATINQSTDFAGGAFIGSVRQSYTGVHGGADANTLSLTQAASSSDPGYAHHVLIQNVDQNGSGNQLTADQNLSDQIIVEAVQSGANNIGVINQGGVSGADNYLGYFQQIGTGNIGTVNMYGDTNGGNNLNANSPVGAVGWNYASASGAQASSVIQLGASNSATLTIDGDGNLYGIKQDGMGNSVGGVVIDGDHNSVGLYQHSDGNIINLANVSGDYNDIGLRQDGLSNTLNVTSTASESRIWTKEQGNDNIVTAKQGGTWNVIDNNIVGDSNVLDVEQDQSATGTLNTATVSITGSNNNNYPTAAALTGAAAQKRDVIRTALGSSSFGQGDLFQEGSNNSLDLTVTTDLNGFATYQNGSYNTITGTVNSGTGNQAVVAQIGSSNSVNFVQSGQGNNIGVSQ